MAEQTNQQPVDPVTAFWRDVWARMTPQGGAPMGGGFPGMPGMPNFPGFPPVNPMAGMPGVPGAGGAMPPFTPEMLKKMQSAWFEAMAQYSEQYMRSPQFLESMKKSMDQALTFKAQMDEFLKNSMAQAVTPQNSANAEVMAAIRRVESDLRKEIAELKELVERAVGEKPAAKKSGR